MSNRMSIEVRVGETALFMQAEDVHNAMTALEKAVVEMRKWIEAPPGHVAAILTAVLTNPEVVRREANNGGGHQAAGCAALRSGKDAAHNARGSAGEADEKR